MAKTYSFKIPASIYLRVEAPDEATAREWAEAWQSHASGWEHFTTDDEPADALDDVPEDVTIRDATAYVETDADPELRATEDDEDDDQEVPA